MGPRPERAETGLSLVTTSSKGTPTAIHRAETLSRRFGIPYVPRRGPLHPLLKGRMAYLVERSKESVTDGVRKLFVDVGLLHAKVASGDRHPLIRALGGCDTVIDGTLGLAGDALHLAAVLGADVHAAELSPVVRELAIDGLARLSSGKWADVASRIVVHEGSAHDLCGSMRADAVFLAPMFTAPAAAAPGYDLFRSIADHQICDAATLAEAKRAADRVVVRVEKGGPAPGPDMTALRGKAVDYWVWSS